MTERFAAEITRCPIPFDKGAGLDIAAQFSDLDADVTRLLAASAACSPYLRGLMQREAAWLRDALAVGSQSVATEIASLDAVAADALPSGLRRAKRRVALFTALADLGGVWPLERVTGALTDLADQAVGLSLRSLVADEIRRGKLPGAVPGDAATAAGMVVLAMGKMGAAELNYSSDIDLVCLFDDSRYKGHEQEARAAFIRVTRRMTAMVSDITDEGYVFRTDLRLRPDASVTPVCLSMAAAEGYYEAEGRTWERAAYIKARPCAGDIAAGRRFLAALTPFVWRKHLDFAAIEDAHDMRLRIRSHRGLQGRLAVVGHDIKLGRGGIREIEFFTQTRQLIAGGRDPGLRDRATVPALQALAAKGWLPAAVADELIQHYRSHRELEHRLQMVGDAQTHVMPTTDAGVQRVADFLGQDREAFEGGLIDRLSRVEALTGDFFAPGAAGAAGASDASEAAPDLSPRAMAIVDRWVHYPALRSDRAQAIFRRLRPSLLGRLHRAANADEALVALDAFLAALPAGVQIFSLFDANPPLVDLIVDIAATSPTLARYLARNAAVLDAVIGGRFFAPWPGRVALQDELAAVLSATPDYERKMDAARVWQKEWHFRVGVHHLRGLIDATEAGRLYADLAQAVIAAIWPEVGADVASRHGPAPGQGAVVVGMGSVGAGRLNAASDLDLIILYDAAGVESSDGKRPLATRAYYAKLTQGLVTALSAPMAQGRLYDVDMRLRPSGRQGPVATSLDSFKAYQQHEAWTWEHLALTRARVLAGDPGLGAAFEAFRSTLLAEKGADRAKIRGDVADMRARLAEARAGGGVGQAKLGPGRLLDIELMAQMLALLAASPVRGVEGQLHAGVVAGLLSAGDQAVLLSAFRLCWQLQAGSRLLSDRPLDPSDLGDGAQGFVLRETDQPDMAALGQTLDRRTTAAAGVIAALLAV